MYHKIARSYNRAFFVVCFLCTISARKLQALCGNETTTIDDNLTCHGDCFKARFDAATLVFLGTSPQSNLIEPFCWLKRPWDLTEVSTLKRSGDAWPCFTASFCHGHNKMFIFFAHRSSDDSTISFTSDPIFIHNETAWSLATSTCGVEFGKVAGVVSPYNCCPEPDIKCTNLTSVSAIEDANGYSCSVAPTSASFPVTTVQPPSLYPGSCEEDCTGYELCNSACLTVRFENASHVFLGQAVSISANFSTIDVFCWLKTPADGDDDFAVINRVVVGQTVKYDDPLKYSGRCSTWFPARSSVPETYLFFSFIKQGEDTQLGNNTFLELLTPAIPTSTYEAWKYVSFLCYGSSQDATATSLKMPFGHCKWASQHYPDQCIRDLPVDAIRQFSSASCSGGADSVLQRYSNFDEPSFMLSYGPANKYLRESGDGKSVPGFDITMISPTCAVSRKEKSKSFPIYHAFNESCFEIDRDDWKNGTSCIVGSMEQEGVDVITSQPIVPQSEEAWQAVRRICAFWRMPVSNCDPSPDPNGAFEGCFLDLSVRELEQPSFNLTEKLKICSSYASDSYADRFNPSANVFFGTLLDVNYGSRMVSVNISCILKNNSNSELEVGQKKVLGLGINGCQGLDHLAARQRKSFIFFADAHFNLVKREIPIQENSQLAEFSHFCGSLSCDESTERVCLSNLNISEVISRQVEPSTPSYQSEAENVQWWVLLLATLGALVLLSVLGVLGVIASRKFKTIKISGKPINMIDFASMNRGNGHHKLIEMFGEDDYDEKALAEADFPRSNF